MIEGFPRLEKWEIVTVEVVKQMPYGLRVRVPSGEIGVIDRVKISDEPVEVADWPMPGQKLTAVSAGYTSSGSQLRLSACHSDLALAKARQDGRGEQASS
ncbi:hypothetical protein [Amycolatopsis sp. WAC 01375]|uniref:hypothetical protein n=1 Tax=Amycolatopsis sp. WAC 01375 TaxID=2203194 RepID=UPI000F781A2D|nr:hypothetical protein [Amycolatopsis sp. WAC 01375]